MPKPSPQHQLLLLPENRSADRALQAAQKNLLQKKTKLIYLYGPSGTGKSHLITQAVREYRTAVPKLKLKVITGSEFAAQLADASDAETIPQFQQSYRSLDLFVCEDLQSLAKRKESQRQLVLCLDALESKGSLIILSSTTLPGQWQHINRRLVDRCRGGLSVEVTSPSRQGRAKLCQHLAQLHHEPMSAKIATLLADQVSGSPRDLKSTIDRLIDDAHRRQQKLSVEYVEQFLSQEVPIGEPTLKKIIHTAARHFGLKIRDLKSTSRRADIVYARQCSMYLMRELTSHTQIQIARSLGKSDHTSVIRACQKIETLLLNDLRTRQELAELKHALNA